MLKFFTDAIHSNMKKNKKKEARDILEKLKFQIASILWDDSQFGYNNQHMLIPWIQEETEYAIKRLELPEEDEQYFLKKVEQTIGEYIEEP